MEILAENFNMAQGGNANLQVVLSKGAVYLGGLIGMAASRHLARNRFKGAFWQASGESK